MAKNIKPNEYTPVSSNIETRLVVFEVIMLINECYDDLVNELISAAEPFGRGAVIQSTCIEETYDTACKILEIRRKKTL